MNATTFQLMLPSPSATAGGANVLSASEGLLPGKVVDEVDLFSALLAQQLGHDLSIASSGVKALPGDVAAQPTEVTALAGGVAIPPVTDGPPARGGAGEVDLYAALLTQQLGQDQSRSSRGVPALTQAVTAPLNELSALLAAGEEMEPPATGLEQLMPVLPKVQGMAVSDEATDLASPFDSRHAAAAADAAQALLPAQQLLPPGLPPVLPAIIPLLPAQGEVVPHADGTTVQAAVAHVAVEQPGVGVTLPGTSHDRQAVAGNAAVFAVPEQARQFAHARAGDYVTAGENAGAVAIPAVPEDARRQIGKESDTVISRITPQFTVQPQSTIQPQVEGHAVPVAVSAGTVPGLQRGSLHVASRISPAVERRSAEGKAHGDSVVSVAGQQHQSVETFQNPPALGPLDGYPGINHGRVTPTSPARQEPGLPPASSTQAEGVPFAGGAAAQVVVANVAVEQFQAGSAKASAPQGRQETAGNATAVLAVPEQVQQLNPLKVGSSGEAGATIPAVSERALQAIGKERDTVVSATQPQVDVRAVPLAASAGAMTGQQGVSPQLVSQIPQAVGQHSAWGESLGDRVVWMVGQQHQSVELHLNPPALGPLDVHLDMNDGQATLTFSTQHVPVKEAIEAATPRLREMLGESGINLGSVSVSLGSYTQQQSGNFAQSNGQGQPRVWPENLPESNSSAQTQGRTTPSSGGRGLVDTFV